MTADPRDPATWPSEPPKDAEYVFVAWPPSWAPTILRRHFGKWLEHGSRMEETDEWLARIGARYYPTPITPANLRAEGEA